MHDPEKSDSAVVAGKSPNKPDHRQRRRWSKGQGPRGTRISKARTGRRAGLA